MLIILDTAYVIDIPLARSVTELLEKQFLHWYCWRWRCQRKTQSWYPHGQEWTSLPAYSRWQTIRQGHNDGVPELLLGPERGASSTACSDGLGLQLVIVGHQSIGVSGSGETVAADNGDSGRQLCTVDVRDSLDLEDKTTVCFSS